MQQTIQHQQRMGPTVIVGLLLIGAGIAVLTLRQAGVDLANLVGEAGWPVFVIGPGLVLLVAAAIPAPPRGIGFAIAGSIVTVVGLLLWYQASSGDWDSWAYLWALIPLSVGVALLGYGSLTGNSRMVTAGLWVGGCAALALVVGAWFFQGLLGSHSDVWSSSWWALLAIAAGGLIVARGLIGRGEPRGPGEAPR